MSMNCWLIEGIGINADDIIPYVNNKKLVKTLFDYYSNNDDLKNIIKNESYTDFTAEQLIEDYVFIFSNSLAEFLYLCDDTDFLVFCSDGEGSTYLYYQPTMPWERADNEPKSVEEVHEIIINIVQKVTDLSSQEIENLIDDELYVVGCG